MEDGMEPFIVEYREAYEAANGTPAPSIKALGRGWYEMRGPSRFGTKYRRKQIEGMTATLRSRIRLSTL